MPRNDKTSFLSHPGKFEPGNAEMQPQNPTTSNPVKASQTIMGRFDGNTSPSQHLLSARNVI
ncbi:MAG: hypothetical protein ABSA47_04615 [Verrucomicrobiota bacterium]